MHNSTVAALDPVAAREQLVGSGSEVGEWRNRNMYYTLTGMCSNYQVVIVTALPHK